MKINFMAISLFVLTFVVIVSSACPPKGEMANDKNKISQSNSPPNLNKAKVNKSENKKMNQENLTAVPESVWGASGVNLQVEENGVQIQYACADGEIPQKLMVDKNGEFKADGVHIRMPPGPTRIDSPPKRQPARYEGKISGDTMTLKVTLNETGEEIANYTLKRGVTPRIFRCQ